MKINDSPKVIFNCRFTYAMNNVDNKFGNNKKSLKRITKMFDYYSDEKKRAMSMFDYYSGKLTKDESMNLVIENGKYADKNEIDKRKQQYTKYLENSNLWQGVISFNNDYINQNITLEDLEQKMIKEVIPVFFKNCGFKDVNKMSYQIALHTDTDNLHFHFSFMEKEPNTEYYKNKLGYRRKGELSDDEINFMKNQTVLAIERNKIYSPLLKETNNEIEELKKYFNPKEKNFILRDKKDLLLESHILKLGELVYQQREDKQGKIKFNSIRDKEIQELTKTISSSLFSKNSSLNNDYNNFKNSLDKINDYFYQINIDNKNNNFNVDTSLTNSKEKYVNNFIYNAIVNHSNYTYNKRKNNVIKEKDIIQEIALKHYIKNKKQSRFNILKNYLSNSNGNFKNRQKMEQAIKSINNELEEAQKEFSKMFQNDNYNSKDF